MEDSAAHAGRGKGPTRNRPNGREGGRNGSLPAARRARGKERLRMQRERRDPGCVDGAGWKVETNMKGRIASVRSSV
jgi:hypothetical protein